jgi:hypothetical protein
LRCAVFALLPAAVHVARNLDRRGVVRSSRPARFCSLAHRMSCFSSSVLLWPVVVFDRCRERSSSRKAATASSIVTSRTGSGFRATPSCSIDRTLDSARSQLRVSALFRIALPFTSPRIHFGQRQRRQNLSSRCAQSAVCRVYTKTPITAGAKVSEKANWVKRRYKNGTN